jgi:glycosyltransferase involved in cell wall biosynthesis
MPLSAGQTPLDALRSAPGRYPGLWRAARAADVVHAHGDMAAVLGLPLLRGGPAVMSTHGLHFLRRSRGPRRAAFVRALRGVSRSAVVVCTSQAEWDEMAPIAGAERMALVLNGVPERPPPPPREQARASLGLAPGDVAALFVGRLEERKHPLLAARAAAAAGVVLLVAGDGPQRDELAALAGERLRLLGHVSDTERLFAAADLYLAPAEREGLSYAMLEAMDAGLAIVASDGPGNPEAVGDAGVVVPAGDEAAWAVALSALAADAGERARLGAAVAGRARTTFSHERFAAGIRAAYDRALATAPGRPGGAAPA